LNGQSPFNSAADLRDAGRSIKMSFTGVGSDDYYGAVLLFRAMETPIDLIAGYDGSHEASLAAVRGEVDGTQATYSTLESLLQTGDVKAIMQLSDEVIPGLEQVPFAEDVVGADGADIVKSIKNIFALDRCIVAPPGLPEDVKTVLRDAFEKAITDPEFLEMAATAKRPVVPLFGEEIDPMVISAMSQAADISELLKEALAETGN
jgi:tripartite-type tricarboxylate transporter receptor subunit TctC